MTKEIRVAKLKKELARAKETIAQLDDENQKLTDRLIQLEDVSFQRIYNFLGAFKPEGKL